MNDALLTLMAFKDMWVGKGVISAVLAVVASILGYSTQTMGVFFMLMIMDFVLGIVLACRNKSWSVRKFERGFVKLATYLFVLWASMELNRQLIDIAGWDTCLHLWMMLYICIMELSSIAIHLSDLGAPLPPIFKKVLLKMRNEAEMRLLNNVAQRKREWRKEQRTINVDDLLHTSGTLNYDSDTDNPYEPDDDKPDDRGRHERRE